MDGTVCTMGLSSGTTLRQYEILEPLGAGAMGEVYRAHDSSLGRQVAIKVLSDHLAADPQMRARFDREAREQLLDVFRDAADFWAERRIPFRCFYSFQ